MGKISTGDISEDVPVSPAPWGDKRAAVQRLARKDNKEEQKNQ